LEPAIGQFIKEVVKEKKPGTVQELVLIVQEKFSISQQEALSHVMNLVDKNQISLSVSSETLSIKHVVFSAKNLWYLFTVALAVASVLAVFMISELAFPLAYVRNVLGSIFVIFLPGFCLVKVLFPRKELGVVEKGALSVLCSLAMLALTSLVLNFTSWGITTTPVTVAMFAQTLTFATAGLLREH
jgi:uncharacterized membrane protein